MILRETTGAVRQSASTVVATQKLIFVPRWDEIRSGPMLLCILTTLAQTQPAARQPKGHQAIVAQETV
jgi:hypothetical protein